ncbi:hypothetical protein CALCODRAFT_499015 [Calocera cornea HHB12733]|uniref:Uncharacterized protein n=1 Tax=Calocera cornea HHB12733 TaxID=1353952 RepID=A0A165EKX1_9BASI|nr:hypothetical protein CALCODRAFT_499015 [Calocera cornea HHB12733]
MSEGTVEGPFELAPWQTSYVPGARHEERKAIDELTTRLSRVLDAVKGIVPKCTKQEETASYEHCPALSTVATLSTEIDELCHYLDLALHKLRCRAFVAHAPVASITRLPDDILARIFEAAAEPLRSRSDSLCYMRDPEQASYGRRPVQITITSVCSRWRTIAHNTTALWNSIVFDALLPLEAAEEWCSQGKATSLDLVLVFPCYPEYEEDRANRVELLNRVSHRLRTLRLVGHEAAINLLASEWTAPAPQLQVYELQSEFCSCWEYNVVGNDVPARMRSPSCFPALRSLELCPPYFPWTTISECDSCCSSSVAELRLTFKRWHQPDFASALRILEVFPSLRTLRLNNMSVCSDMAHTTDAAECSAILGLAPVRLDLLQSLHVTTGGGDEECFQWLRLLNAPNLRTVDINHSQRWQRELLRLHS